jgi:hypothetical protein
MHTTLKHLASAGLVLVLCLSGFSAGHVFQPDPYLRHIRYLASDELKGRGNGTQELDKAAEYIASQFKSSGLQPAGNKGTYFQEFLVTTGSQLGPGNTLTLDIGHTPHSAVLNKEFTPFGIGEKTEVSGELVFAGYGISAEEFNYDDYKGLDVTDKIVLALAHEPREKDSGSRFNGIQITPHGQDNTKAINAKYRGARAILIVQDPANHSEPDIQPTVAGAQVDDLGICALRISRGLAQRLLDPLKKDLLEVQKQIDQEMAPQSFSVPALARVKMDVVRVRKTVRNVVALLPGKDRSVSDETVILGAHYDHLGFGGRSSMSPQSVGEIHNGADDNASGTAGLIELAAALAKDKPEPRRSYLFIAFAGEELGLNGSQHWTRNPTRSIEKSVAMLNMDMIGRLSGNQIVMAGIGTSPAFPELVKNAATHSGIEVKTTQSGYGTSDHTSFYVSNIPVLFFFSGLHSDYHRPSDDTDKINAAGATKILNMVYWIATELNRRETRPQFTKVQEPMTTGAVPAGGSGYGAFFGSIPDMTDEVQGVRFSDVRPNSPAAKAGLKGGDTLVQFDGFAVKTLEDFTYMLRTHKPGQTVDVTVLRDGKPLTVKVTLEVRR